jgi:hypothetical protein
LLWVYEKSKPPRRGRPEKECLERDFFEFEVRGKNTNNSYEIWLSHIEANAAALLPAIKERRSLGDADARIWAHFVASLFGRSRKVRAFVSEGMTRRLREQTESPDFMRDLQHSLLQRGELHFAQDIKQKIDEIRTSMDASPSFYHISGLPNRTQIIVESLLTRAWHTIEAPQGTSFLVSDCPVVTCEVRNDQTYPGAGFGKENTVAMLPVSAKHLWVASPPHLNWMLEPSISGMNNINRLIVQFAHLNVYSNVHSEETRVLVDTEVDTLVFGKNAFVPPGR